MSSASSHRRLHLTLSVISSIVKEQLGDMTFQEAYEKTRRVLNVIIPFEGGKHPVLLNFLTTPNVVCFPLFTATMFNITQLIWTAAVASNSQGSFPGLWGDVGILCKDENGEIIPWNSDGRTVQIRVANISVGQGYTSRLHEPVLEKYYRSGIRLILSRDQPFARISASFNINNFILSRPYPSIPFLTSSLSPSAAPQSTMAHLLSLEVSHRISQLDSLGLIPSRVRRLLGGERVPAEIVIVPRLRWKDLLILGRYLLGLPAPPINTPWVSPAASTENYFDSAARQDLGLGAGWEEWIFRGEQGVWEVGSYIRAKCAVEITLDHRNSL